MDTGVVIVIVVCGMVFGMTTVALVLDHFQKMGRKRGSAGETERIKKLEEKAELQEQQISELIENQRYTLKLVEDQHDTVKPDQLVLPGRSSEE